MKLTVALATLVTVSHARFSGSLYVRVNPDGSCQGAGIDVADNNIEALACQPDSCGANGNQIASTHFQCTTHDKGRADVFTYPHDTLKFCRTGFCSCMTTYWRRNIAQDGYTTVEFSFDDDAGWSC